MMGAVPKLYPESTIVCLGGGPSLTQADVDYCRGKARVIAINDAYRLAPWADVLYACDGKWWDVHKGVMSFEGLKFGITAAKNNPYGVTLLRNDGPQGLCLDPRSVRVGGNSGYQAINVAVHLGARRIVLLGYDMCKGAGGRSHWFGEHPKGLGRNASYQGYLSKFPTLVAPLKQLGVEVINCTRTTVLNTFPKQPLAVALPMVTTFDELCMNGEIVEATS